MKKIINYIKYVFDRIVVIFSQTKEDIALAGLMHDIHWYPALIEDILLLCYKMHLGNFRYNLRINKSDVQFELNPYLAPLEIVLGELWNVHIDGFETDIKIKHKESYNLFCEENPNIHIFCFITFEDSKLGKLPRRNFSRFTCKSSEFSDEVIKKIALDYIILEEKYQIVEIESIVIQLNLYNI